jgi:lipoate-protein ligase B
MVVCVNVWRKLALSVALPGHGRWRRARYARQVSPPLRVIDLGTREFAEVWRLQLELVAARQRDEIPDTLLVVEHPHVITMGRGARRENLLAIDGVPVFAIERGGDVTYHGPGQLVAYPIFRLEQGERDLHLYMRRLEEVVIRTAGELGVAAGRQQGSTGVWTTGVPARKLASLGVAVKRGWVTLHGLALNVATDLGRFSAINPCGFDAGVMTSLSAVLGRAVTVAEVAPALIRHAAVVFDRRLSVEDHGLST